MATPSIQTLITQAQQVLNLQSSNEIRATLAAVLANANVGTPLNPNLTTQQLWDEFDEIVRQSTDDIMSIIVDQMMRMVFSPPAPGGAGADKQVIFNDGGVLAGDAGLMYNKATDALTITGDLNVSGDGAFIGIGRVGLQRPFIPTGQNGTTTLDYRWYSTGTTYVTGARIRASSEAAWSSVSAPTRLMFETVPSGSVGLSERYRISGDGLHTWSNVNNVGGTQMTLDGTGLGIGGAVITTNFEAIVSSSGSLGGTATVSNIAASAIGNAASFNFRTNANFRSAGYSSARIEAVTPLASNNTDLVFYNYNGVTSSGDETMRITSSGNVGIGVVPSAWTAFKVLQVGLGFIAASSGSTNARIFANTYYNGQYRYIANGAATQYEQDGYHVWLNAPSGTAGASAAVTSGQSYTVSVLSSSTLAQWQAFFSALTVLPTVGQAITATATGSIVGGGTVTQYITFTAAMTLDASGNLLLGQTTAAVDALGGIWLKNAADSNGSAVVINHRIAVLTGSTYADFNFNSGTIGSITQSGTTAVLYNTTSDYRLKESVAPLSGGLARVNALKPSVYNWKSDGSTGEGFIAHELAEVVPFAVSGEKDAVNADGTIKSQGIDMSRVVPILVAAIQELTAEVNALKNA